MDYSQHLFHWSTVSTHGTLAKVEFLADCTFRMSLREPGQEPFGCRFRPFNQVGFLSRRIRGLFITNWTNKRKTRIGCSHVGYVTYKSRRKCCYFARYAYENPMDFGYKPVPFDPGQPGQLQPESTPGRHHPDPGHNGG